MNKLFSSLALSALFALSPAASTAQEAAPYETRLIQLVLVEGSVGGSAEISSLPENVRPAIDDIRQFLPFKGFRLLDTSLVRSNRRGQATMRGPEASEYLIGFQYHETTGQLMVEELVVQEEPISQLLRHMPPKGEADASWQGAAPAPRASRTLLRTSFAAEIGKTVVVGSSRLNGGDKALIVLFTALP